MTASALDECTVAIVGLGLMGGSLGLALRGHCAHRIGIDIDHGGEAGAIEAGAIDEFAPLATAAARADIVVLAVPVRQVALLAGDIAAWMRPGRVLTDLGSTKVDACAALDSVDERIETIGGHPMCGREVSGITHADGTLFQGARWVLSPTLRTTEYARALVGELVDAAGAIAVDVDRHVHDEAVATASHLPYVIAQALAGTLVEADARTSGVAGRLAATGFRGATRLASGDVQMWLDVLATNEANVRTSIGSMQRHLADLADALDDAERLEHLLRGGRAAMETARTIDRD
ncbi:MAG: putative prephenate dehydrogenase [Thermoleophilia bacterium]|nr:putative prephenate dehydrogenase [Thermoleophilia bacterium]